MKKYTEIRFEEEAEQMLLCNGYLKGVANNFDSKLALFSDDVIGYISASQPLTWKHVTDYNGENSKNVLIGALTKELDSKGALYVLRHGFRFFGRSFKLANFKPNTTLNPDAWKDYENNILKVYRQVHYSENNPNLSLDMVISLNGIPVVTIELKNPLSGQTVENAKWQYKNDRDPRDLIFQFKKRSLVHFAVDTEEVYMTTKLNGQDTHFLPFNKGYNLGSGNPPVEDNYRTSYLWEEILAKDSLLDIIGKYLHLEVAEKKVYTEKGVVKKVNETLIFPRFHQLDVVKKLVGHAKVHGSGHNYLIQHSAGSGKSNSIAWLAYRLSSLHNDKNEKVFSSVVVITDRTVLDQQLQDTIYQFEHTEGVVQKIDEDTKQLVKALSTGVPIIVSTIQKFPFIVDSLEKLNKERKEQSKDEIQISTDGKKFAVIVDEAHSSQSGEAATELKKILNKEGIQKVILEQMLSMEDEPLSAEAKENLLRDMAKRPKQPNISFFAFTATPKYKTKVLFNEPGPEGTAPFHLYSMRQAIEEGFILDVLENYTTYKTFFKLVKEASEDPKVPKRKTSKALSKFVNLHPYNIRQKVELIIEHFRTYTRYKIGGRAKAMIVTGSRLSAVRYKQQVDAYILEKGYKDLKSLVAFSGTVNDDKLPDVSYTETGMNKGIKERELPEKFESYEYHVLIVAEKYQTGFDQPLLHTMYVDKRLEGVQAVQTLSRLNRNASGKSDTFVLDFVNERDTIFDSFKPYYESTKFDKDPDPQLLYQLEHTIMEWRIFYESEINEFCEVWFRTAKELRNKDHRELNAVLDKAIDRFKEKTDEEKETFKKQLTEFRNLYTFLSQIIPYTDSKSEKMYAYVRNLLRKLPRRDTTKGYELGEDVALKYYRLEKMAQGKIDLKVGGSPVIYGPNEVGTGNIDEEVLLSTLVERLNERFGTQFTPADQLFFDQVKEIAIVNDDLAEVAKVNPLESFYLIFDKKLESMFVERMEGNEEIFIRLMNDPNFRELASKYLAKEVYYSILEKTAKSKS